MKSGIEANLVNNPISTNVPQIISKVPVKYDQKAGWLNPICKNRPVPNNDRNKYF
jgi:hypothetical protein